MSNFVSLEYLNDYSIEELRNATEKGLQMLAIKDYFNTKADRRKLLKYSKVLSVEDKIRTYMEVL